MFDKHKISSQGSPQIKESIAMQEDPPVATPAQSPTAKSAVIGSGIEITGDVTASVDLTISGHIKGSIVESSHNVEIDESGKVNANITAKVVLVAGKIKGNITGSEKVLISSTAKVQGNIIAPRVQLEDGALFRGSIDMDPGKVVKPDVPAARKKEGKSSQLSSSIKTSGNGTEPAPLKDKGTTDSSLTLKGG